MVAIVGARESGKTSLIASLYGLLQSEPIAGFSFAGSRSLLAFEVACHDARAASQRGRPHFERTQRGAVGFYDLTLLTPMGQYVAILIGDRAGEEYVELTDDPSDSMKFVEIVRADVLTLLVDGHRLLDVTERHNLLGQLGMMLQSFKDGDALAGRPRLAIALTKVDELECSQDRERADKDFARFVGNARKNFGDDFAEIESFHLAPSPTSGTAIRGQGVPELLQFWMKPTVPSAVAMGSLPTLTRAFDRLQGE